MNKEKENNNSKKLHENKKENLQSKKNSTNSLDNDKSDFQEVQETENTYSKPKKNESISRSESEKEKEIVQLKRDNENLKKEKEELKNKYLLLSKFLDNKNKDFEKEIENKEMTIRKMEKKRNELLKNILFFPDSYEMSMSFGRQDKDPKIKKFLTGFEMILTQFQKLLKEQGVEEIKVTPLKDTYEVGLHELLSKAEENNNYPEGTILEVLRKGYKIFQQEPINKYSVLRPALVKISTTKI